MEIRRGPPDIPQAGDLEDVLVLLAAGDLEAAEVGMIQGAPIGEVVAHRSELREKVASRIAALMAGDAALPLEELIAFLLPVGDGRAIAAQEAVEARDGDQRSQERGETGGDLLLLQGLGEDRLEVVPIVRVVLKDLEDLGPGVLHLLRVEEGAFDLLLEGVGASIPELPEVEGDIKDGGRVAVAGLAADADRHRAAVGAAARQIVAAGAGDRAVLGE